MDFRCNSCHTLLVRTSTCYYTANCGHIYCEGCICQLFPQNWVSGGSNSGQQQYGGGRDHHESQDTEQQSLRSKFNINDPHFSFKSSEYHQIYDGGTKCVICHARIQPSDIKEILLGIQSPISIIDHMLQYIFQNTNWSSILENLLQLSSCTTDLSTFIYQQLLYEITYQQETSHKVIKKMEQTIEEKANANHQYKNEINVTQQRIRELEHHIQMREKELCDMKEAYAEKVKKCDAWEKAYHNLRGRENSNNSLNNSNKEKVNSVPIDPERSPGDHPTLRATRLHKEQTSYRLSVPMMKTKMSYRSSFHLNPLSPPTSPPHSPSHRLLQNDRAAHFFNQLKSADSNSFFDRQRK